MAAQRGSLNLTAQGAFLAVSLPTEVVQSNGFAEKLRLEQGGRDLPLEGLLLQPAHEGQTLVLGRFASEPAGSSRLRLDPQLLAQPVEIIVTRGPQSQWLKLDAAHPDAALMPTWSERLLSQAGQGAQHILAGADHLVFLLLVLAAGLSLPALLGTLTAFTLGHATTLALAVFAGLSLPERVVEPSIAATLVGMAWFDARARASTARRMALVFACALIHGLGLAQALEGLPIDTAGRVWALLGFNAGIELAQIAVALPVLALARALGWLHGLRKLAWATGLLAGSIWFVQRLAQ